MNQKKMTMMASGKREEDQKIQENFVSKPPEAPDKSFGSDPRTGYVEAGRKGNVGFNLFQVLAKYIKVD